MPPDRHASDVAAVVRCANHVLDRARPGHEPVEASTTLDEAGIESLELTEILVELEALTGAAVSTDNVSHVCTVADIATLPRVLV